MSNIAYVGTMSFFSLYPIRKKWPNGGLSSYLALTGMYIMATLNTSLENLSYLSISGLQILVWKQW